MNNLTKKTYAAVAVLWVLTLATGAVLITMMLRIIASIDQIPSKLSAIL